jgi:hypothetical protein
MARENEIPIKQNIRRAEVLKSRTLEQGMWMRK